MFLSSSPDTPEPRPQSPQLALRVAMLGTIALVAFGVLLFRLWALQVLASNSYQRQLNQNSVRYYVIPAPRGRILDSHGRVLVRNRAGNELQLDPSALPPSNTKAYGARLDVLLRRLAPMVHETRREMRSQIAIGRRQNPLEPVTIAHDIPANVVSYIAENARRFQGVTVLPAYLRYYPQNFLAAHVFGVLYRVTAKELADPRYRGVDPSDDVGQSGVEGHYDAYLRGTDGKMRVTVSPTGYPVRGSHPLPQPAPIPGYDLRLTIDERVQREAQNALAQGIVSSGGDAGAIVVMDPNNGQIRAMASFPSFNPNWLVSPENPNRFPKERKWLFTSKRKPQFNRAIGSGYAAGSTFKPITATAAIAEGLVHPDTPLYCSGSVSSYGTRFHNWDPNGPNIYISLPTALSISCDTYFYRLGTRIYAETQGHGHPIQRWAWTYGFGHRTGIDISGENKGLVPSPEWKHHYYKKGTFDWDWHPGDSVNLSIGQGNLQVTPLQMAVAYGAIANGGKVVTPHIGLDIERGSQVVQSLARQPTHLLNAPPATLAAIRDGLVRATHDSDGTASKVFGSFGVSVAGKTGTAEVAGQVRPNSWFASYAPADKPQLVVVVVIEKGGHGGTAAAPTALNFYSQYFHTPAPALGTLTDKSN